MEATAFKALLIAIFWGRVKLHVSMRSHAREVAERVLHKMVAWTLRVIGVSVLGFTLRASSHGAVFHG